jgi:hypothetical protein
MKKGQRISIVFFSLCSIFVFFVPYAMATTIIAFRTSNELILAADSLNNRVISSPTSSCDLFAQNSLRPYLIQRFCF